MPTLLHISDLHFGRDPDQTSLVQRQRALDSLVRVVRDLPLDWKPQALVISGDLSWQGRERGYLELRDWLIGKLFPATGLTPNDCVICPGNHDIDRDMAWSLLDRTSDPNRADSVLRPERLATGFALPFSQFVAFAKNIGIPAPTLHKSPNYLVGVRELHGVRFICLNSAWFSRSSETDQGQLWLGLPQLQSMPLLSPDAYNTESISIAVVHHPVEWFAQWEWTSYEPRPAAYNYLCERTHVILSGHTHGAVERSSRYNDSARLYRCGATYESNAYRNNFSLIRVDVLSRTVSRRPWEFDPRHEDWQEGKVGNHSLLRDGLSETLQRPTKYIEWLRDQTQFLNLYQLDLDPGETPPPSIDKLYCHLQTDRAEYVAGQPLRGEVAYGDTVQQKPYVPLEQALKASRLLIIEGKPGSGKTTFLQWITWNLCRPVGPPLSFPVDGFPILISIRQLDRHIIETLQLGSSEGPSDDKQPRWLAHFLASRGLQLGEDFFSERFLQADTILLLDGMDEALDSAHRESIAELIRGFSECYTKCRIVLTTRPGAQEGRSHLQTFVSTSIEDLDDRGIDRFLLQWCRWLKRGNEHAAQEYFDTLKASILVGPIRRLATNPLMLTALAVLHLKKHRLPEKRAQLFEDILNWLADQAVQKHEGQWRKHGILDEFGKLALAMHTMHREKLLEIGIDAAAQILAGSTYSMSTARQFLEQAQVVSGIVTLQGKEIAFWHQSFQDYLAARVMIGFPDLELQAVGADLIYRPAGREVLPLLAAQMVEHSRKRLDLLMSALVYHALSSSVLDRKACAAGVLQTMLQGLEPYGYVTPQNVSEPFADLLKGVMTVFDGHAISKLDLQTRIAAAEALDYATKTRLRVPNSPGYWVDAENYSETQALRLRVGRFPVTVSEFGDFLVESGGNPPSDWNVQERHPGWPVTRVAWETAVRYCKWASAKWKINCRLPTKEEWVAAAGGTHRLYPWASESPKGNDEEPNDLRANCAEMVGGPTPVGMFPDGRSPIGALDMIGNVWEWTSTDYGAGAKVVKGGCWHDPVEKLSNDYEDVYYPAFELSFLGFRCIREDT